MGFAVAKRSLIGSFKNNSSISLDEKIDLYKTKTSKVINGKPVSALEHKK
jgi:hypothetical protein